MEGTGRKCFICEALKQGPRVGLLARASRGSGFHRDKAVTKAKLKTHYQEAQFPLVGKLLFH